jgi:integrase
MCHRLLAYTAVRISNGVSARWEEFDLEAGLWVIPRAKMKMQDREHDHKVVLPEKLVAYLRTYWVANKEPASGWLFPGAQGREHVSREAVEKVLLENGFRDRHTCHGWRASFSTLAKDGGFEKEVVDLALDHVHDSDVAMAYDRGERLTKRRELMRWWGRVLDGEQSPAGA